MFPHSRHLLRALVILVFGFALMLPWPAQAQERDQDHVVTRTDLHQQAMRSAQTRKDNLAKIENFFSQEPAQQALGKAQIQYEQVRSAVSMLDDAELERLASRTDKIQSDFAAGALTNQEITYIIIALVTAVVIIVIVVA
ncbi:MAG: hypothetical protein ACRD5F_12120 [Candidatus Acidiferrales bacterium]